MKKIIGMIRLVLLVFLSACNSSNPHDRELYVASNPRREIPDEAIRTPEAIIGTWDIPPSEEFLEYIAGRTDGEELIRPFFYTFNADGTGEMQHSLMDEPVDLSWEIYDDILTIHEHARGGRPLDWDFGVVDDALYLRSRIYPQAPRLIRRD